VTRRTVSCMISQTVHRTRRRSTAAALIAAATVVLTGCLNVQYDVNVEADGSGSMLFAYRFDTESIGSMYSMFGEQAPPPGKICAEILADADVDTDIAGTGLKVTVVDDGTSCGFDVTGTWSEPAGFAEQFADANGALGDAADVSPTVSLTETDSGGWRLEMYLPSSESGSSGADIPPMFLQMFAESATFAVNVTLPGKISDHNGATVDGSTVSWEWSLFDPEFLGSDQQLFAESDPAGSSSAGSNVVLLAVAGLLVAAVVAVGFFLRARRNVAPTGSRSGPFPPSARTGSNPAFQPYGPDQFTTGSPGSFIPAPFPPTDFPPTQPTPQSPPPPPPPSPQPPAGWYPDPSGQATSRWWDGSGWSDQTSS
jgi:hypothetical protein